MINNFKSSNSYLFLPTKRHPKVALAIDTKKISKNSFMLYNPFSFKAKVLKNIAYLITLLKLSFFIKREITPSSFILFLEEKLDMKLISSLYFATEKDKVVLQLQTENSKVKNSKIIGYIKYPLTLDGKKRLENEKRAIDILFNYGIVDNYILFDTFNHQPFLFFSPLEGNITMPSSNKKIYTLLETLKRDKEYILEKHPRIITLKKDLKKYDLDEYLTLLQKIIYLSKNSYTLVYEHGDFTPWNIMCLKNGEYKLFDFEYFIEDGIEYFDLIKYFYQIGKLLKQMDPSEIIAFIYSKIKISEKELVLQLFLLKEILKQKKEKKNCDYEIKTLKEIVKL